jgi:hypothetical protein
VHGRDSMPIALEDHRLAEVQHALLGLEHPLAGGRLEVQRSTDPQRLAVDAQHTLAVLGLDPGVVAEGDELLAHPVAGPVEAVATQKSHGHSLTVGVHADIAHTG